MCTRQVRAAVTYMLIDRKHCGENTTRQGCSSSTERECIVRLVDEDDACSACGAQWKGHNYSTMRPNGFLVAKAKHWLLHFDKGKGVRHTPCRDHPLCQSVCHFPQDL